MHDRWPPLYIILLLTTKVYIYIYLVIYLYFTQGRVQNIIGYNSTIIYAKMFDYIIMYIGMKKKIRKQCTYNISNLTSYPLRFNKI